MQASQKKIVDVDDLFKENYEEIDKFSILQKSSKSSP